MDSKRFPKPYTERPPFQSLSEDELNEFFDDLDRDKDGHVVFEELEAKLEQVHEELAPDPKRHHLHHPDQTRTTGNRQQHDPEKGATHDNPEHDGLCAFLHHLMPDCTAKVDREAFKSHVKTWNIPSRMQTSAEDEKSNDANYEKHLSLPRRLRAYWSVQGPQIGFIACVILLQIAFGVWQGVYYIKSPLVRAALGWGVIMAKFSAGALYPTMFFVFLSMSRWFSTYMRRFYWISRFINWDHHQAFHVIISCTGLVLATIHAIGHLTGTFLYGSRPAQQDNLALILPASQVPKSYGDFIRTTPGWTGLIAIGLYWLIAGMSMPVVRKWSYEVFQVAHLLMFPLAGLLCAHGTAAILQSPALGYVLAFPVALVIFERVNRILRGFRRIPARMEILDDDTVAITCKHPKGKNWRYQAGQYIFLQIPAVSFFQWHPFTVSLARGEILQVHIKCEEGGWTGRLRGLPEGSDIHVGIDGPFGAPAQRFYNFDRSVIVGSGIGVTPFSAILNDIEQTMSGDVADPWRSGRSRTIGLSISSKRGSRANSRAPSIASSGSPKGSVDLSAAQASPNLPWEAEKSSRALGLPPVDKKKSTLTPSLRFEAAKDDTSTKALPKRRVDFIWSVRERNYLLWFSSILNQVHETSKDTPKSELEVNIRPYITAKRQNISTHVFRYLLDRYRTPTSPVSALTGLKMESNFGRPDFEAMLADFHNDMRREQWSGKVGVFFCGSPVIGRILSDTCSELTARARGDGSGIRYVFMMEVFG